MAKQPKTTNEHIISLYGYITGLKREVSTVCTNWVNIIGIKNSDTFREHRICKIDSIFLIKNRGQRLISHFFSLYANIISF